MEKGDDIDDLFKAGLAKQTDQVVYQESDWGALENLLDNRKKRDAAIYWLKLACGVAASVLLVLGWWLFHPVVVHNSAAYKANAAKHSHENTGRSGGAVRQSTHTGNEKRLTTAGYADGPVHPGAGVPANHSSPHLPGAAAAKLPAKHLTNGANEVAVARRAGMIPPASGDKKDPGAGDQKNDISPVKTLVANKPSTADKKDLGTVDDKKDEGAAGRLTTNIQTKKTGKTISPSGGTTRAVFALTAIASSDMNGISPLAGGRLGGNFGALLAVSSGKWTFSSGGMYSIKPYQESFSDYHTSYVFQTNPATVGANCRMIDIPLDVNYQVFRNSVNKFTVGTGLSSYIILQEEYTFNYADPYAGGPTNFSVANRNRNIMSILNLDATYERRINSTLGVILQPYLKLPLSNVGASQVRLQSTGVAVGLSWNLNSLKKPD